MRAHTVARVYLGVLGALIVSAALTGVVVAIWNATHGDAEAALDLKIVGFALARAAFIFGTMWAIMEAE